MKLIPKLLTIIFSILAISQCVFIILSGNVLSTAQATKDDGSLPSLKIPEISISIPTVKFTEVECKADSKCSIPWLGEYIGGIYKYLIGIVGIISAIVLMYAGLRWLTAGGNSSGVTEAQAWIKASLTGLVIALSSYFILYTINPDLVILKPLEISTIKPENLDIAIINSAYITEETNANRNFAGVTGISHEDFENLRFSPHTIPDLENGNIKQKAIDTLKQLDALGFNLTVTSLYHFSSGLARSGMHGQGRGIDVSGTPSEMMKLYNFFQANPDQLPLVSQAIHNRSQWRPGAPSVVPYNAVTVAGADNEHVRHVHLTVKN